MCLSSPIPSDKCASMEGRGCLSRRIISGYKDPNRYFSNLGARAPPLGKILTTRLASSYIILFDVVHVIGMNSVVATNQSTAKAG